MKTKKWTKVLSFVLAFAMVFGLAMPVARAEGSPKITKEVIVHKLLLKKEVLKTYDSNKIQNAFKDWSINPSGDVVNQNNQVMYENADGEYTIEPITNGVNNTKLTKIPEGYNGSQDSAQFKKIYKLVMNENPVEIAGACFAWQDKNKSKVTDELIIRNGGEYPNEDLNKAIYIKGDPAAKDKNGNAAPFSKPLLDNNGKLQYTLDPKEAMRGVTTSGGVRFYTDTLPEGNYQINEIHDLSSYVGPDGQKLLTDVKAVPVVITLPLANRDGVVEVAHVYPKNTDDKPTTDKNIDAPDKDDANKKIKIVDDTTGKYLYGYGIGDLVPFKIEAIIPDHAHYKTAFWSDQMTKGLTFQSETLVVKLGNNELVKDKYYKLEIENNGFKVSLLDPGLDMINNKAEQQKIVITYKVKMNSAADVEKPEKNDVIFHYGNNPNHGNTPVPQKPLNQEMLVNKSWVDADGNNLTPPVGTKAKFTIYDAATRKPVKKNNVDYSIELDGKVDPQGGPEYEPWKGKFTGLDNNTEYYIVEDYVTGYSAEYSTNGAGNFKVKNWKDNNPKPINPTEPEVENLGKKFVKTGKKTGENVDRLAGAQFVVYKQVTENGTTKNYYMVPKAGDNGSALKTAKDALDAAIAAYNKDNSAANLAKVNTAQATYNTEFIAAKTFYEWKEGDAGKKAAKVYFSNDLGQLEVTGLGPGEYYLEELVAPEGYAKLSEAVKFIVNKDSYTKGDIDYVKASGKVDAQEVKNREITIPETGGIGTVIFTVVGIVMVAGAFIILRKNREDQYA